MLHLVSDDPALQSLKPYCITRESFERLLNFLESGSYTTTTFKSLVGENKKHGSKKVILTFDDCYRSLFDFVIPELQKRNMTAVFFMPAANIGGFNEWDNREGHAKLPLMNHGELLDLKRMGMEVGSHSCHHVRLASPPAGIRIEEEISSSKSELEEIIGEPVISFAYPYGSVPKGYKNLLKKSGYRFGLSIFHAFYSRWALRRIIYHDGDTARSMKIKLSPVYSVYRQFLDIWKGAGSYAN